MKQNQPSSLIDFPAPETLSAERQVLADVAMNPGSLPDVMEVVTPDLFATDSTRRIWETMVAMYNAGEQIDMFTLRMKIGPDFTKDVIASVGEPGTELTALQHAKVLRDEAARRMAYNASVWLLGKSTTPGGTEDEMVEAASTIADRFQKRSARGDMGMAEVMGLVGEDVQKRIELAALGKSPCVASGIPSLDRSLCGGFEAGQLVILAARPSVGKTAMMLQLARTAAERGVPGMIFSIEMTEAQLGRRMLLSTGLVTREQLSSGTGLDWDAFNQATALASSWPITINATSTLCSDIVSKITTAVAQHRCGVAFIDYLGLIKGGGSAKDMTNAQRIGEITKALKIAAKRCNIPIVLLCQLNREKEKGSKRAPELTDLRDSGEIEQDADVVLMLDQEDKIVPDGNGGAWENPILVLWVRKMREGVRNFRIDLMPNESYTRFTEIVEQKF